MNTINRKKCEKKCPASCFDTSQKDIKGLVECMFMKLLSTVAQVCLKTVSIQNFLAQFFFVLSK